MNEYVTLPFRGPWADPEIYEDGDLVSPGQPLLRLHPEGVS